MQEAKSIILSKIDNVSMFLLTLYSISFAVVFGIAVFHLQNQRNDCKFVHFWANLTFLTHLFGICDYFFIWTGKLRGVGNNLANLLKAIAIVSILVCAAQLLQAYIKEDKCQSDLKRVVYFYLLITFTLLSFVIIILCLLAFAILRSIRTLGQMPRIKQHNYNTFI